MKTHTFNSVHRLNKKILTAAASAIAAATAHAATIEWTKTADDNWNSISGWAPSTALPALKDNVVINNGATVTVNNISASGTPLTPGIINATAKDITLGGGSTLAVVSGGYLQTGKIINGDGTGKLKLNGGIIRADSSQGKSVDDFFAGFGDLVLDGNNVAFNQAAFTLDTTGMEKLVVKSDISFTRSGADTTVAFHKKGNGHLYLEGTSDITVANPNSPDTYYGDFLVSQGRVHIDTGTFTNNNAYIIGSGTPNTGGTVVEIAGGTWINRGQLQVGATGLGDFANGTDGYVNLTSGTVTAKQTLLGANGGYGVINISGGTWTNDHSFQIINGALNISGTAAVVSPNVIFSAGSSGIATLNLTGGRLTVDSFDKIYGSKASLVFGDDNTGKSGTVVIGNSTDDLFGNLVSSDILLKKGGVTFEIEGIKFATIDNGLSIDPARPGTKGDIRKTGTGTLTLNGEAYDLGTGVLAADGGRIILGPNAKYLRTFGFATAGDGTINLNSLFSGGTLAITAGANSVNFFNGFGNLNLNGTGLDASTASLTVDTEVDDKQNVCVTNTISNTGGNAVALRKKGTGTLTLNGNVDLAGSGIIVNNGTLAFEENSTEARTFKAGTSVIGENSGDNATLRIGSDRAGGRTPVDFSFADASGKPVTVTVGKNGTGTLALFGPAKVTADLIRIAENTGSVGTLSFAGAGTNHEFATLTVGGIEGGAGTSNVTLGGGKIVAARDNADFFKNIDTVEVRSGIVTPKSNFIFDTAGHNIGFTNDIKFVQNGGFSDNALEKQGDGTLTLSGDFSGPAGIFVTGGTLDIAKSVDVYAAVISADATHTADLLIESGASFTAQRLLSLSNKAALDVKSGASVTTGKTEIASTSGSVSTADVNGVWNNTGTWSDGDFYIGKKGTGTLNLNTGGTVTNVAGTCIGYGNNSAGTLTLDGGTWNSSGTGKKFIIGGSGTGTLNIKSGSVTSAGDVFISRDTDIESYSLKTGDGTANITGGTFNVGGDLHIGYDGTPTDKTTSSTGTLNIGGTGIVTAKKVILGTTRTEQPTFSTASIGNGVLNLTDGGTLRTGSIEKGDGEAKLNLNGGTIVATGNNTDFFKNIGDITIDGNNLTGDKSALTFDTGGNNITIANNIAFEATYGGQTGCALEKTGTGTLTLAGTVDFTAPLAPNASKGSLYVNGGTLVIANTLTTNGIIVGEKSGDSASVVLNSGKTLNTNSFNVGTGGTGTLTLNTGSTLNVLENNTRIGQDAGANGTVTADGATLNNNCLLVGDAGTGTLNLTNGSKVSSGMTGGTTILGRKTGGQGTVTLTGKSSINNFGSTIIVGDAGTGDLDINGNSRLDTGLVILANQDGGKGSLTLGTGILATTGLTKGTGTAAVAVNGGTFLSTADNKDFFGSLADADITIENAVTFDTNGKNITVDNNFNAPDATLTKLGLGTLTLTGQSDFGTGAAFANGGTLALIGNASLANGEGHIAVNAGDNAAVTLADDAKWTLTGMLDIGSSGKGTLALSGNAIVETGGDSYIGNDKTSDGTVTLSDQSRWNGTGNINIGTSGKGTLTLNDNAVLTGAHGYIGANSDADWGTGNGTATLNGQSRMELATLRVGNYGNGILNIKDTALVKNNYGYIGDQAGSTGTVTLSGGTWENAETLTVGGAGKGTLNITDGTVTAKTVTVGAYTGSEGTLNLGKGGTIKTGGIAKGSKGTATLNLNGGTIIATADNADFFKRFGTLTLNANGLAFADGNPALTFDTNGHNVTVTNTLDFNRTSANPLLALDKTGDGTLTLSGTSDISGTAPVDKRGQIRVSGGTLNITGSFTDTRGAIGDLAGTDGTVTVGNGGTWNNTDYIVVGRDGTGALDISGTGKVTAKDTTIGNNFGSTGKVTLRDGGSLTNTGTLTVASVGTGLLEMRGGKVSAAETRIQYKGTLLAGTGTGANVLDTPKLTFTDGAKLAFDLNGVSDGNTTLLTVNGTDTKGISADNGFVTIDIRHADGANLAPGTYTLFTVTNGAQSLADNLGFKLTFDGVDYVSSGRGGFSIIKTPSDPGAIDTSPLAVQLAYTAPGTALDLVWSGGAAGAPLAWKSGDADTDPKNWINKTNAAKVQFVNGDSVTFDNTADVAHRAVEIDAAGVAPKDMVVTGDNNTAYFFSGGAINAAGKLIINEGASASFKNNASFGAFVYVNNGTLTLGDSAIFTGGEVHIANKAGDMASLNIYDDAKWNGITFLDVGSSGNGTLKAGGRAVISTSNATFGNGINAVGNATLTANSRLESTGFINVGQSGKGSLELADEAKVTGGSHIYIGTNENSSGTVALYGRSSLEAANTLRIGGKGKGELTIAHDAVVKDKFGYIGDDVNSIGTASIRGGRWENSTGVIVGFKGQGTLNVEGPGYVQAAQGIIIGYMAGSVGSLNLVNGGTIEASSITKGDGDIRDFLLNGGTIIATTNNDDFFKGIGDITLTGTGLDGTDNALTFEVVNGKNVTIANNLTFARPTTTAGTARALEKTGTGTLTLSGTNDFNTRFGNLYVNAGKLNITGSTTNNSGVIGEKAGNDGNISVADGATWANTGNLLIGKEGSGVLNLDGGTITVGTPNTANTRSYLGYAKDSYGSANVNGGTWTTLGDLYVGNDGTGELVINDGTVSDRNAFIGEKAGAAGSASISGGKWINDGSLTVGDLGTGTLEITGGEIVVGKENGRAFTSIANGAGSEGTVTVSGGKLTTADMFYVGKGGTGKIDITGGEVANGYVYIGHDAGSTGTANVSGGTWNAKGVFIVGNFGTGTLNVSDTANITVTADSYIGNYAAGTAKITGGTWTTGGALKVGTNAAGTLDITGGTVTSGNLSIATGSDSTGKVNITGGTLNIVAGAASGINVASYGNGELNISGAGTIVNNVGGLGIASADGVTGKVTVSDGAAFTNENIFSVGGRGTGTLDITGGNVTAQSTRIATDYNGTGIVNLSGGTFANAETLSVGHYGNGTLNISGGTLSNHNTYIGTRANAATKGSVVMTGGTWENKGRLAIGLSGTDQGSGTLEMRGADIKVGTVGTVDSGDLKDIDTTIGDTGTLLVAKGTTANVLQTRKLHFAKEGVMAFELGGISAGNTEALLTLNGTDERDGITFEEKINIDVRTADSTDQIAHGAYKLVTVTNGVNRFAQTPVPFKLTVNGTALDRPTRAVDALLLSLNYADQVTPADINLISADLSGPQSLVWTGGENNIWRNDGGTADESVNWQTTVYGSKVDVAFKNNDTVRFDSEIHNRPQAVTIDTAGVTVAGMTVNAAANNPVAFDGGTVTSTGTLTKTGAGTAHFATTGNTFAAGININAGTLQLGANNVFVDTTNITLTCNGHLLSRDPQGNTGYNQTFASVNLDGTDTHLDAHGTTQTVRTLTGTGNIDIAAGTLNLSEGDFSGAINNTDGTVNKNGSGVLTFRNIDALGTGNGNINVNDGILMLRDIDGYTGDTKNITLAGGWLDLSESEGFDGTGTGANDWSGLNITNNDTAGTGGIIGKNDIVTIRNGSGWVIGDDSKKGLYVVIDAGNGNNVSLADNNTYVGTTRIKSGWLELSDNTQIGDTALARNLILDGGNLRVTDDVDASARALDIRANGTLTVNTGKTTQWKTILDGTPSGAHAATLTKNGTGKLVFTETVDYAGTINVNDGDLVFRETATLDTLNIPEAETLSAPSGVQFDNDSTVGNLVAADGARIQIADTKTLTLNGTGRGSILGTVTIAGTGATVNNTGALYAENATVEGNFVNNGDATIGNIGGNLTNNENGQLTLNGTVAGTEINNTGRIFGGIRATNADVEITNENSVTGSGADAGIVLANGGTVNNRAGANIEIGNNTGILIENGSAVINNDGRIHAPDGPAIRSAGTGVIVNNRENGSIYGDIQLAGDNNELNLDWFSGIQGDVDIAGANSRIAITSESENAEDTTYSRIIDGTTTFTGTFVKKGTGVLTLDRALTMKQTDVNAGKLIVNWTQAGALNDAAANIAAGAELLAKINGDTVIKNQLQGTGRFSVNNTGPATASVSLDGTAAGGNFTGTLAMGDKTKFALDGNAESALASGTLALGTGSEATLDANRTLGGLDLAGGTFAVTTDTAASPVAPHTLNVTTLGVSGASELRLADDILIGINTGGVVSGNVFDIDEATGTLVVNADTLTAGTVAGTSLAVKDAAGNDVAQTASDIKSGDDILGKIYHSYVASVVDGADGTGIRLGYGVSAIESLTQLADGLGVTIDSTGSVDKTLSAKLTGAGGFIFQGGETMTLASANNDYAGQTRITGNGTTVVAGVNNALGNTSGLEVQVGTTMNFADKNQTIAGDIINDGAISTAGTLNVAGTFTGTGALTLDGTANVGGEFSSAGNIALGGTLNLAAGGTINGLNILTGTGTVNNTAGTLTVNDANTAFTGTLNNTEGANVLLKDNFAGTINNEGILDAQGHIAGSVNNTGLARIGTVYGTGSPLDDVSESGTDAWGSVDNTGTLLLNPNQTQFGWGAFSNNGHLDFVNAGNKVYVDSLAGNGTIRMDVDAIDASNSDALIIRGDVAPDTRQTLQLNDVTTNPNAVTKNTTFNVATYADGTPLPDHTVSGRVHIGLYTFDVGLLGSNGIARVVAGGISPTGQTAVNTAGSMAPGWFSQLDNLVKRMGELRLNATPQKGQPKEQQPKGLDIWFRGYGQETQSDLGMAGVSDFTEYQYGGDVGADKIFTLDERNKLAVGGFVGYQGASRDFNDSVGSDGDTNSTVLGLYATWMHADGWYADTVLKGQYSDNSYDTRDDAADFDSYGLGISLEVGKQWISAQGWFVEPSLQFAYSHFFSDNYATDAGLNINVSDSDVYRFAGSVRFGRTISMRDVDISLSDWGIFQYYAKLGAETQVSSGGDVRIVDGSWRPHTDGTRMTYGVGIIWQLDAAQQIHVEYEGAFGDKYDKPWGVNVGYRVNW